MEIADKLQELSISSPHFFKLPRELRDEIYELCCLDQRVIHLVRGRHPQWILTCKQIFNEAAPMLYNRCCLYRVVQLNNSPNLLDQIWMSYSPSFPTCNDQVTRQTFEHVKGMISNIAIDVQLDMTVENLTWLGEHYFSDLDELTNLKHLYVHLIPNLGSEFTNFRRQISRSDLRIFHLCSYIQAVKALTQQAPKNCKIYWSKPNFDGWDGISDMGEVRSAGTFGEITVFMMEVSRAVRAEELERSQGESEQVHQLNDGGITQ